MPPKKGKKRATAQPQSYDEFMEAALYQESQATRYQFGEKSQRHYEEAGKLYGEAGTLASDAEAKHDALYNLGRVQYSLATEIHGIPQCFHALKESINLYRQCLHVQPDSIDAAYNLAQSLRTLGEWAGENGPSTYAILATTTREALHEARVLLGQVEAAQMAQMTSQSGANTPNSSISGTSTPVGDIDAAAESGEAREETVITPSAVIETILSNVEATIAMIDADGDAVLQEADALLQRAQALNERDRYMDKELDDAREEVLRTALEAQAAAGQRLDLKPLQAVAEAQQQALSEFRRPDPAKMSELADTLFAYVDLAARQGVQGVEQLQKALELYESARSNLSSPLGRPASIPAHHIPSLLSANWRSTAESHLLLSFLASQPGHLVKAKEAALQALDTLEGAIRTTATSSASIPKFAKSLKTSTRHDYRTIAGARETTLLLVRIYLLSGSGTSEDVRPALASLIKATWPDKADLQQALESFVQECQSTALWQLSASNVGGSSEEQLWQAFVQSL